MTIESDHLLLFTNESKIGRLCSNFEKGTLTVFLFYWTCSSLLFKQTTSLLLKEVIAVFHKELICLQFLFTHAVLF